MTRPGIVLVAVILLLVVLGLTVTTSTLVIAQADAASHARADGVRAHLAAESAARAAVGSWDAATIRRLALLEERPLPGSVSLPGHARGQASVRRIGLDLFLVAGEGSAGQARARAGMVVRVLSLASLLAPFPAAIAGGGGGGVVQATAHVSVISPAAAPPGWWPFDCLPGAADTLMLVFGDVARPGILTSGSVAVRAEDISGFPPVVEGPAPSAAEGLGPLGWDQLARLADRTESGTVTLEAAASEGRCETAAPGNWGDPHDRASPCSAWFPLIYAPGDLHVAGGSGQGVLVVRGNLVIDPGVEFYGPILAGNADIAVDARIWGAVTAGTLSCAGTIAYSPCALLRALSSAPALGRPFRTGQRLWARIF